MLPAVTIQNLSKRYLLRPGDKAAYGTFRDDFAELVKTPLRMLRGERRAPLVEFWALNNVSFDVTPGEVVGLIGRNGSGKSTLLKILSRTVKPTGGRATMRGRVGSLLEVGTGFHPELTGRENIFLSGAILGMSSAEIRRKFDEIVAFSEIEKFLGTPVKRYSSGMYVRLAFAVAAHLEPEILIVDEVLAVGDGAFQKKCLGKMREVSGHGRTVLFVSHNMGAITGLCTTAVHLNKGEVVAIGEAREVTERYLRATREALSNHGDAIDLAVRPRRSGVSQQIKYTAVELQDAAGETAYAFPVGAPITVALELQSQIPASDVVLSLSVKTSDGVVLWTTCSDDLGSPWELTPGSHIARVLIAPNYLRPGLYTVSLSLDAGGPMDLLEDAVELEIMPIHVANRSNHAKTGCLNFGLPWMLVKAN